MQALQSAAASSSPCWSMTMPSDLWCKTSSGRSLPRAPSLWNAGEMSERTQDVLFLLGLHHQDLLPMRYIKYVSSRTRCADLPCNLPILLSTLRSIISRERLKVHKLSNQDVRQDPSCSSSKSSVVLRGTQQDAVLQIEHLVKPEGGGLRHIACVQHDLSGLDTRA